jgi:hypothetical protein
MVTVTVPPFWSWLVLAWKYDCEPPASGMPRKLIPHLEFWRIFWVKAW